MPLESQIKVGRKNGIILLASCFALGYVLTIMYSIINAVLFVIFVLVGLAAFEDIDD